MTKLVVLTGATGFLGSAIVEELNALEQVRVRSIVRNGNGVGEIGSGDIRHGPGLAGALQGADVLIHAASYVGPDAARAWEINDGGTHQLVDAAAKAGVSRILSMSTAAVYGTGPHRFISEHSVPAAPESAVSASRLAGEQHVIAAGGTVLRPNLVYGRGDRHFIPTILSGTRALGAWVDEGAARISVIGVDQLARLTVALALADTSVNDVVHASHPTPVSVRELISHCADSGLPVDLPTATLPFVRARQLVLEHADGISIRQFDRVATENTFDSTRAWELANRQPGPRFHLDKAAITWYRGLLTNDPSSGIQRR